MLKLNKKIAVTGNVAAGKSTVCRYFKQLGAYTVDADSIAKEFLLLSKPPSFISKITSFLGKDIVVDGKIEKEKIANIVFSDKSKLRKLEKIMHKKVFEIVEKKYLEIKESKDQIFSFFIVEMPLLFESKLEPYFDYIITVTADTKKREKRFSKKFFLEREQRLLKQEEKAEKADFIIENISSFSNLKKQVIKLANLLSTL